MHNIHAPIVNSLRLHFSTEDEDESDDDDGDDDEDEEEDDKSSEKSEEKKEVDTKQKQKTPDAKAAVRIVKTFYVVVGKSPP